MCLGAGTMGTGIAMALANADCQVLLFDRDDEALQHGFAAFAARGQGDPGIALGAQRNAQGVGEQRRGEEEGAQQ